MSDLILAVVLASAVPGVPYAWEPAPGPVAGYEVRVEDVPMLTTPWPAAWVHLAPGHRVTVRDYDAEGSWGPLSEPSEPWDPEAHAERAAVARADYDGDCVVSGRDVGAFSRAFNVGMVPGCEP